jgi:hypothetical protein
VKLLAVGNTKTLKGEKFGYMTFILSLAPANVSGYNTCPMAGNCAKVCIFTSGRGIFQRTQDARIRKTRQFFEDRDAFMQQLVKDIIAAEKSAKKQGFIPVFRLNGFSDIRWETVPVTIDGVEYRNVMEAFPHLTFYDYTKLQNRKNLPDNYYLTFSRSEDNQKFAESTDMNVAVVFGVKKGKPLPETWNGRPVIDGDDTDLRFLDPKGVIVGLRAKGAGRKDYANGFVVRV